MLKSKQYADFLEHYYRAVSGANRPLTLTEKLLAANATSVDGKLLMEARHVALQNATGQAVALQVLAADIDQVRTPASWHNDHLSTVSLNGAEQDFNRALEEHSLIYTFAEQACARLGMSLFKPGAGIIHANVAEYFMLPGIIGVCTDSHASHSCLGSAFIGVGGPVANRLLLGLPWRTTAPKKLGINLVGDLPLGSSPKDIILHIIKILGTKGGVGYCAEYFGEGLNSLPASGGLTLGNMGVECGLRFSTVSLTPNMASFYANTGRSWVLDLIDDLSLFQTDPEVVAQPERFFDKVITVNLSELEPLFIGPDTHNLVRTASELSDAAAELPPLGICSAGSCTHSNGRDIRDMAQIARWAAVHGFKVKVPFIITPGSLAVRELAQANGDIAALEAIGATFGLNACAFCIGRASLPDREPNSAPITFVGSFNRAFKGRATGDERDKVIHTSPAYVVFAALSGKIGFDPRTDLLNGISVPHFTQLPDFDQSDYQVGEEGNGSIIFRTEADRSVSVEIPEDSERLAEWPVFGPPTLADGGDIDLLVLAEGTWSTDAISPAGQWLDFRGNLGAISRNLCSKGLNAITQQTGTAVNPELGQPDSVYNAALSLKKAGRVWGIVSIGEEPFGQGSSREHAPAEIRYCGGEVVLARKLASIFKENAREYGILTFEFVNPDDCLSFIGVTTWRMEGIGQELEVGSKVYAVLPSGQRFELKNDYSAEEVAFYRFGCSLAWVKATR